MNNRLTDLQVKVDEKFQEIQEQYAEQMRCSRTCYHCCRPGLSISKVEQVAIQSFLKARPQRLEYAKQLAQDKPWSGAHCEFLNPAGECSIYEVRPVICRSHGAPIKFREGEQLKKDVCTLNFQSKPIATIEDSAIINLDLLNTLLALINHAECDDQSATKRFPLTYQGIVLEEGAEDLRDIVSE